VICERKAEVFSKMKRIYSEKRYMGGIREFERYNRVGRRI